MAASRSTDVLVVEDDVLLADFLERAFLEEGYRPTLCGSLASAGAALAARAFDVVVLDRMLPDGDGLDLCARLKERVPPVPVLILTARGEVPDRVAGLRAGADDYVTKPFDVEELLARIEAVRRRSGQGWISIVGALEIDRRAQVVRANGRRIELTAREYALLARLAEAPGTCVSRAALLHDVWNMRFDPSTGVIDVGVSRLRDKLGSLAWMVETVRAHGLRLRTTR